ncbi:MAG: hypothetical protein GC134_08340 [Proteobacteria bacterium]|nr:hypothetical protein [Pseudomonadota bacterium]
MITPKRTSQLATSSGQKLSDNAREGLHWSLGLLDWQAKGYPQSPVTRDRFTDLILVESDLTVCEIMPLGNTFMYKSISWLVDNTVNRLLGTRIGHVPYVNSRAYIWFLVTAPKFTMWSSLWGVGDTKVMHFRDNERADNYAARLAENPHVRYWHFRLS